MGLEAKTRDLNMLESLAPHFPFWLTAPVNVIGHQRIKRTLVEQRAHAILLTGPARVGRRVLARWYAQYVNCRSPLEAEPCGSCPSCLMFAAGTHPDYLEVGPKEETSTGKKARSSVIPITAISQHHDKHGDHETHVLSFLETSARERAKFVVFDGAEFLNEAAANALLKTVEEPPHGSRFVFVAEDSSAVMPTIVSRSVSVRVPPLNALEMERAWLSLEPELDPVVLDFAAGRPGLILERERVREALQAARGYLKAVRGDLLGAFTQADQLDKHWDRDVLPDALRFVLRNESTLARGQADAALGKTIEALEQYASPSLAFAVMTLEWRSALT